MQTTGKYIRIAICLNVCVQKNPPQWGKAQNYQIWSGRQSAEAGIIMKQTVIMKFSQSRWSAIFSVWVCRLVA